MAFKLPELKYGYDALEPHIDELTMKTHHSKHHQTYVDNLNKALDGHKEYEDMDIEELLKSLDKLPESIQTAVRNNGGGHYNHTLFWDIMGPDGKKEPSGELKEKINDVFGSMDKFKEEMKNAALGRFGSGWAWLVLNEGKLEVVSTLNQDNPISEGKKSIMGIDVWEHAYYLKYMNKRADYVDSWWNTLDWDVIEKRYETLK